MVDTERMEHRPAVTPAGYSDAPGGAGTRASALRRVRLAVALGAVALAVLGFASFEFVGHATGSGSGHVSAAGTAGRTSAPAKGSVTVSAGPRATASALPTPRAQPASARPALPPARAIVPVSAVAFGPDGTADGDNPQAAGSVITDSTGTGWQTDWYTTASFGGLKPGTGLLLDMGRTVAITAVRLTLGGAPGARVELRLGAVPSLAGLRVVRSASASADVLTLPLAAAVSARYILLWFTSLPPDGTGTYQVSVLHVTVDGRV